MRRGACAGRRARLRAREERPSLKARSVREPEGTAASEGGRPSQEARSVREPNNTDQAAVSSTSISSTLPRAARTGRSVLAPGARVRKVQFPSPAKNRK